MLSYSIGHINNAWYTHCRSLFSSQKACKVKGLSSILDHYVFPWPSNKKQVLHDVVSQSINHDGTLDNIDVLSYNERLVHSCFKSVDSSLDFFRDTKQPCLFFAKKIWKIMRIKICKINCSNFLSFCRPLINVMS